MVRAGLQRAFSSLGDEASLPSTVHQFFTSRSSLLPYPHDFAICTRWVDMVAALLRESNCSLSRPFRALVNDKGSVTLVVVDTSVPTSSYTPYFETLIMKLN